ncbi:MAG: hypothetical protein ACLFVU_15025 [Phycisphaerae bacterium]
MLLLSAAVQAKPKTDEYEGPLRLELGEVVESDGYVPGDKFYRMYFTHMERDDQDARLWIPGNVKTIRGVIFHIGTAYEPYKSHLQEFARTQGFAVAGGMWRWARITDVIPHVLTHMGKKISRPELEHAPLITMGFSRSGRQALRFIEEKPERTITAYIGGSPGVTANIEGRDKQLAQRNIEIYKHTPVIVVNGSQDAFVGYNPKVGRGYFAWAKGIYPRLREKHLPFTMAVEWGPGHESFNNGAILFPFWKRVIKARYPKDGDPSKGPVKLKPFDMTDGTYLASAGNWGTTPDGSLVRLDQAASQFGDPVKYEQFEGDKTKAVWLPDAYTAAVWNAFCERPRLFPKINAEQTDGKITLSLAPAEKADGDSPKVEYFDGNRSLGTTDGGPLTTDKLSDENGVHSVYALVTKGKVTYRTQPLAICGGKPLDQMHSKKLAGRAKSPIVNLSLSADARRTLEALDSRRSYSGPSEWKLAFSDDFSGEKLRDVWYEYYHPKSGKTRKGNDATIELVDGALQVKGNIQAVAMLPYNWADDVAVEYRARAMGKKHCDLSVVLSGNPSGSAFPWREGMMFQFGAHYNRGSHFLIYEQPRSKSDAKIEMGTWHTVRVERLDGKCKAIVDGKLVSETQLTDDELQRFYGQRIGLYVFGSTGRFDDVKIYLRKPTDPAKVTPKEPSLKDKMQLAGELAELMTSPYKEQRYQAWRMVRTYSPDLAKAFDELKKPGRLKNEKTLERIDDILEHIHPGVGETGTGNGG